MDPTKTAESGIPRLTEAEWKLAFYRGVIMTVADQIWQRTGRPESDWQFKGGVYVPQ